MGILKRIIVIVIAVELSLLTSCKNNVKFSKSISRYTDINGWVYTATYFRYNDGRTDNTIPPLTFSAINLRYRYSATQNKKTIDQNVIQILGDGVDEASDRDMIKISKYLGYYDTDLYPTIDEILSQSRTDFDLEYIDKKLFFDLIDSAVNSEPKMVGKYYDYPSYALLNEQNYINGYQIQIGYALGMGNIDVIMIDVLYQSNDSAIGYVQLSDIVKEKKASDDQNKLFNCLVLLESTIVNNNDFKCKLQVTDIESIDLFDFNRLYDFLDNIEKNTISKYVPTFQAN